MRVAGSVDGDSRNQWETVPVDLRGKFQLKSGQAIEFVDAPDSIVGLLSELETGPGGDMGQALLVFLPNEASVTKRGAMIVKATSSDRLTWVAYPKAGKLGTDLNRDSLAALLIERGVQPVRQIAIDDVWSALRFRPS
jgi:hypothetical protein